MGLCGIVWCSVRLCTFEQVCEIICGVLWGSVEFCRGVLDIYGCVGLRGCVGLSGAVWGCVEYYGLV